MDIREQLFSKPLPSNRTAYKKAIKAAKEIAGMFCMSDKMLLTISYIFEQMQEVTPLALQKILYFIQNQRYTSRNESQDASVHHGTF